MRAAFYESDITPPLGCYMSGYGSDRRAANVYDKLHAKALVLEQSGVHAVIISVDICEYPPEMPSIVSERIFEYTGIIADSICITSTHTHYGAPVTDDPSINCFGDDAYKDVFYRLVADSAILAFKRLEESRLYFGSVTADGIANNRCSYMKDGTLRSFCSNFEDIERPLTDPDHELPVLFVEQEGTPVGVMYCFCCHQDTTADRPVGYSGDYSSAVSDVLKQKYGNDFISLYLPGPSGDINHVNPRITSHEKMHNHRTIGKKLAEKIVAAFEKRCEINGDLKVVKQQIDIPKRKYSQQDFENMLTSFVKNGAGNFRINNLISYHICDKDEYAKLYVQLISIGDFAMHIYPGEMFVSYSHRTKKNSPYAHVMVIEHSNAYGGYIPIPEAFGANADLYETSPAYDSFLIPEAGEILLKEMLELSIEK